MTRIALALYSVGMTWLAFQYSGWAFTLALPGIVLFFIVSILGGLAEGIIKVGESTIVEEAIKNAENETDHRYQEGG